MRAHSLKVGYAGQNFPEHQYPSIVGRPILRAEERSGDMVCSFCPALGNKANWLVQGGERHHGGR